MLNRTVLFLLICLLLSGCQSTSAPPTKVKPGKNDVVETHGGLENFQRLDQFVKHVQNNKKDKVRLIRYTIEGDRIFHDLAYDGSNLKFTLDTTGDKFGQGEVTTTTCESIQKQESETETKYMLTGCPQQDMNELLVISHDVDKEDFFAFELKYGVGLKNAINTKDQKLIKDLQNGETVQVSDFQFTKQEINQIYKLMILSNYLNEKKLFAECNKKTYESYELKVWINSAERQYNWSECDKSKDGEVMTRLVQDIVAILKNNHTYQSLPEVKGSFE
ncbi:DUF4362 domain-containing protein [Neobacillus rhizophilus]|uniref:DUF4362 domain-containing protein n=1 Tax=Neobacillus rhizophilus TaxID=2833579 RepID=A0A942U980_9BACI|nr:DUF4362 domain-containing protein [Neobacillus rhizophilus]MBS4213829.1 DUF4362 domain-containing protein [Neobacillus rhizophilus]